MSYVSDPLHSFFVAGDPVAQPRPRACVRGGRAHVYNPTTARAWRQLVAAAVRQQLVEGGGGPPPSSVPVRVDLGVRIPRAKSNYSTRSFSLRPSAPKHHLKKPDVDNLAKAILDELGPLINDDRQIVALTVRKRYITPGEESGVSIKIWLEPSE